MTIREICEQIDKAYYSNAISLKDIGTIMNTKIVPRKLVEEILEEIAKASKEIEDDEYLTIITDFDDGYLCALKDFRIIILKLLADLEGEE